MKTLISKELRKILNDREASNKLFDYVFSEKGAKEDGSIDIKVGDKVHNITTLTGIMENE